MELELESLEFSSFDSWSSDSETDVESLDVSFDNEDDSRTTNSESDDEWELYESFSRSLDESLDDYVAPSRSKREANDTPFYSGSSISSFQAMILIFQFVLKHSLSNRVFTELLQLLLTLLPTTTKLLKTVYLFKKFFADLYPETTTLIHYYCSTCQKILPSSDSQCCNTKKIIQICYSTIRTAA